MDMAPAHSPSSKLPHCIKSFHLNTKEHRSHNLCFPKMCPPPNGYKNLNSLLLERACTCLLFVKLLLKVLFMVPLPSVLLEAWATHGASGSVQGQRCLCR